jgi:hypothetical protein
MKKTFIYQPENLFNLRSEVVLVTGTTGQLGSSIINGLVDLNALVLATEVGLQVKDSFSLDWKPKPSLNCHSIAL